MRMRRFAAAAILGGGTVLLLPSFVLHAQQQPNIAPAPVLIDTVVTDRHGQLVKGLTASDFEIVEDGQPQQVQNVTMVDLPVDAPGRTYLFAIDMLHMSPSGASRVQPMLQQFVERYVGPRDRAAFVMLSASPAMSTPTGDRPHLLRILGETSEDVSLSAGARMLPLGPDVGAMTPDRRLDSNRLMFDALVAAIRRTPPAPGRRTAVIFVTEGLPTPGTRLTDAVRETMAGERDLYAAAARANVNVYPLDPVGMRAIQSSISPENEDEPAGLAQWSALREIADNTGGRAILGRHDLDAPFRQIVEDSSAYYVLAYQSPHGAERDGEFHKVSVHVKRKGVSVRARKGWYEPKRGDASPTS